MSDRSPEKARKRLAAFPDRAAAEAAVPRGPYCYDAAGLCPFWGMDRSRPAQENGYCALLGEGDADSEGFSLLWDQCKECGIRDEAITEGEAGQ